MLSTMSSFYYFGIALILLFVIVCSCYSFELNRSVNSEWAIFELCQY